jgi:hypothetical protein
MAGIWNAKIHNKAIVAVSKRLTKNPLGRNGFGRIRGPSAVKGSGIAVDGEIARLKR